MKCLLCQGESCVVRQSEKGSMIGLCQNHAHINLAQINRLLYRRAERSFCKTLLRGF